MRDGFVEVKFKSHTRSPKRTDIAANVEATIDTKLRAETFFKKFLPAAK